MTEKNTSGKTTLTPNVILTIAKMAALEVEGVNAMAPIRSGVPKLKSRGKDGVNILIEDDNVFVNIYLVLDGNYNIRDVSRKVQLQVSRAIIEMTGLEVGLINIHIEDIVYKNEEV
ncbi:MAG: Asp23/Gls24 family envelope stress response protein [Chloroflexota bacterium]